MRRLRLLLTPLVVAVLLTGCARLQPAPGDLNTQLDTWVEQHRYDRALTRISELSSEHPQYQDLNRRTGVIEEKRARYIERTLEEAGEHESERDWAAAIEVIDSALANLPEAPELLSQREEYEQRRRESVTRSERAIQLAHGRYLLATRASEENLLKANPNGFFAQQRYRAFQQDLTQASRELYVIGREALYENDTGTATQALTLSNRLSPNELSQQLLNGIQQARENERTEQREAETAAAEQQWPQLESAFEEAMQLNDLIGARRLTREMRQIDAEATAPLQARLDERIDAEANALAERGRLLYGQGFLQQALAVWHEALELKPDDPELRANTQRVETFLENLDRWDD